MKKVYEKISELKTELTEISERIGFRITETGETLNFQLGTPRAKAKFLSRIESGGKVQLQGDLMNIGFNQINAVYRSLQEAEILLRNGDIGKIERAILLLMDASRWMPELYKRAEGAARRASAGANKQGKTKPRPDTEDIRRYIAGRLKAGDQYKAIVPDAARKFSVKQSYIRRNFEKKSFF